MATTVSFVRLGSHEREGRARFALLLGALLAFAVYKAICLGREHLRELPLAIAFDSCVWMAAWLLSEAFAQAPFARNSGRFALREWLAGALFYPLLYLGGGLVFAHTWFFDAAVERRLTMLDV